MRISSRQVRKPTFHIVALMQVLAIVVFAKTAGGESVSATAATEPQRGTISGRTAAVFGASALGRGIFSLPPPFAAPQEEGAPLWDVFPTYSPDAGLSEWGMGWSTALSIKRWRPSGEVNFTGGGEALDCVFPIQCGRNDAVCVASNQRLAAVCNRFVGPWGPMSPGNDSDKNNSFWYPDGFSQLVRVQQPVGPNDPFVAYLRDGRVATFSPAPNGLEGWWLSQVQDTIGRTTTISYVTPVSAVGNRMIVAAVQYGGVAGGQHPYEIKFNYAPSIPGGSGFLSSATNGILSFWELRVASVDCLVRGKPRWTYRLGYENSQQVPALYYLTSVTRSFPSGDSLPPMTFVYDRNDTVLGSLTGNSFTALQETMSTYGLTPWGMTNNAFLYHEKTDGLVDFAYRTDLAPGQASGFLEGFSLPSYGFFTHENTGDPFTLTRAWQKNFFDDPRLDLLFAIAPVGFPSTGQIGDTQPDVTSFIGPPYSDPNNEVPGGNPGHAEVDFRYWMQSPLLSARILDKDYGAVQTATVPVLADLNSDGLAEIVDERLFQGDFVEAWTNTGSDPLVATPDFAPPCKLFDVPGRLDGLFVQDVNGDGHPDIITRSLGTASIDVWLRVGQSMCDPNAYIRLPAILSGPDVPLLGGTTHFSFIDANKDGLVDLLAKFVPETPTNRSLAFPPPMLFLGAGISGGGVIFNEVSVPAFDAAWVATTNNSTYVMTGDLLGDGNEHVLFFENNVAAPTQIGNVVDVSLATQPSGGLMTNYDDGQGTSYAVAYQRVTPTLGLPRRTTVLSTVDVTSTGERPYELKYQFTEPTTYPGPAISRIIDGQPFTGTAGTSALIGFTDVTVTTAETPKNGGVEFASQTASFMFSPDVPQGLLTDLATTTTAAGDKSGVHEHFTYTGTTLRGLPFQQPLQHTKSLAIPGTTNSPVGSEVTNYADYAEACPQSIGQTSNTASGAKTETTTIAYHPLAGTGLANALTCLPDTVTAADGNRRPAWLSVTIAYKYDASPQLLEVDTGSVVVRKNVYDPGNGTLTSTTDGAGATTKFGYTLPPLVSSVTLPDGRNLDVGDVNPVTDAPLAVCLGDTIANNCRSGYERSFRYDGMERLTALWDNVSEGSSVNPLVSVSYRLSSAASFAAVTATTLVDAGTSGTEAITPRIGALRTTVSLSSAAGRDISAAELAPGGWVLSGFVQRDQFLGLTTVYTAPALVADPLAIAPGTLPPGAQSLSVAAIDALGFPASTFAVLNGDASGNFSASLGQFFGVSPDTNGAQVQSTVSNTSCDAISGACATTSSIDVAGRLRAFTDEAKRTGTYDYDSSRAPELSYPPRHDRCLARLRCQRTALIRRARRRVHHLRTRCNERTAPKQNVFGRRREQSAALRILRLRHNWSLDGARLSRRGRQNQQGLPLLL